MERNDRMKSYEKPWRQVIPAKSYTIIRVDGRAFHTLTRGMAKPFDTPFMQGMDSVAMALCDEIQGAQFAYVQSDEVSVLVTDFGSNAQQWFGGELPKMISVSAAEATSAFRTWQQIVRFTGKAGTFDSRVFTVPDRHEAINYFLARQADCHRNAVQMIAQAHFSQRELHKKNAGDMVHMLADKGVYLTDFPAGARRGRVVTKHQREETVTFTHTKTGEVKTAQVTRNYWEASDSPWFDWDEAGFLELYVPLRGDEKEEEHDETPDAAVDSGPC